MRCQRESGTWSCAPLLLRRGSRWDRRRSFRPGGLTTAPAHRGGAPGPSRCRTARNRPLGRRTGNTPCGRRRRTGSGRRSHAPSPSRSGPSAKVEHYRFQAGEPAMNIDDRLAAPGDLVVHLEAVYSRDWHWSHLPHPHLLPCQAEDEFDSFKSIGSCCGSTPSPDARIWRRIKSSSSGTASEYLPHRFL